MKSSTKMIQLFKHIQEFFNMYQLLVFKLNDDNDNENDNDNRNDHHKDNGNANKIPKDCKKDIVLGGDSQLCGQV